MHNHTSRHVTLAALVSTLFLLVSCGTPATPAAQPTAVGTPATPAASTLAATAPATAAPTLAATIAATTVVTTAATNVATATSPSAATAAPTAASTGVASSSKTTIVLGDFSSTPAKTVTNYQPLADYLGTKLGKDGITSGEVKVAPDFDTLVKWLKSGEVDLVFDTPYSIMLLMDAAGAQPILRRWKGGDSEWYAVIFAHADSGMKSLDDFKGQMIAVQDPYSTSGFFMPLAYIAKAGIKSTPKDSTDTAVSSDEVGYVASKDDDNTLQWVVSGKVAAGATDFRHYESIPEATRKQFVVLFQSDKVPRNIVLARPGMDPALIAEIKAVLVDMDKSDEGKKVLKSFQSTAKFDELPGGPDAALASSRELLKIFKNGAITVPTSSATSQAITASTVVVPPTAVPTAAATSAATKSATRATTKNTLVLADISDNPTKRIAAYQPLADYL